MKKVFSIIILSTIFGLNIYALGVGGGYSVDSGINVTMHFQETEKNGVGVGIGVSPTTSGGIGFAIFGDYYYDFNIVNTGNLIFGPELAIDVGLGVAIGDGSFGMIAFASPAAGVKICFLNGKLDVFLRYQPWFGYNGVAVNTSEDTNTVATDISLFNPLGFALGVRYHF